MIHLGRLRGGHVTATLGLLLGFLSAFGSDLVIERAATAGFLAQADKTEIRMATGDFFFEPNTVHLSAGRPVQIVIENHGEAQHEIEILGMGEEIEETIPYRGKAAILLYPQYVGTYPFICDMPGHLAQGMRGTLIVE